MSSPKTSRFAVFIHAGIGNTVFLIPLVKALKSRGFVTAIATSPFDSEELFEGYKTRLFDRVVSFKSVWNLPNFILQFSKYDAVYFDYFSATRKNLFLAHLIGKQMHCFRIPDNTPTYLKSKIKMHLLNIGWHEGSQNLSLYNQKFVDDELGEHHFKMTPVVQRNFKGDYITIQPGAGNNRTPFKTWDLSNWLTLLTLLLNEYKNLNILVLGDQYDLLTEPYFKNLNSRVVSLIHKTKISELPGILYQSKLHIGGDSGLLHITGTVGTKSITVVGGSDPKIFGWHKINPEKHLIIKHSLPCHPCYRHYLPNQTKTSAPAACPDFKCLKSISAQEVFESVKSHLNQA